MLRNKTASSAMTSSNVDGSSLALGGGTGVVGVNTASVFLNTAGAVRRSWSRLSLALMYVCMSMFAPSRNFESVSGK